METPNGLSSIWEITAPRAAPFDSLHGSHHADVAIVGAGISGLTAARLLSAAGKRVVVIEAHRVGAGTTGRSTGNLYATVDRSLARLEKKYDSEVLRQVTSSRLQAIDFIEATVKTLSLDCQFQRVPFVHYLETDTLRGNRVLDREAQAASRAGLHVHELATAPLPFPTRRALMISNQAQFHPLRYVQGLADSLRGHVQIFENTPALEVQAGRIRTPRGEIHTKAIILATHSPVGVRLVQFQISPIREHAVAYETTNAPPPGAYWSVDKPKHSIRTVEHGERSWILAIGEKYKTGHRVQTDRSIRKVASYLTGRFRVSGEPVSWSAQAFEGSDALPYIGEERNGIHLLTGFSTDGLVYGTLGAMILSDQILGRRNMHADLYRLKRLRPLKSAKILTKEGLDNAFQYLKDLPKLGTCSLSSIAPGKGGVVEARGEKMAVYRDEQNQLHAVSAVCTHMKCIVKFNEAERTWDCPCHASRFTTSGEVIEGPAMKPLAKVDAELLESADDSTTGRATHPRPSLAGLRTPPEDGPERRAP